MKATIRLATKEYCYIEFEAEGTAEEIIAEEDRIQRVYKGGFGVDVKEWNRVLDKYLVSGTLESKEYESLTKEQQGIIQEIKKANKRINK